MQVRRFACPFTAAVRYRCTAVMVGGKGLAARRRGRGRPGCRVAERAREAMYQLGDNAGPAWCLILIARADAASNSWKEQILINLFTISRSMAKLEYAAVRLPFTLLDERIVARYWHDQGLFRLGFQRLLGSIDELAGWLLADDDISGRGQALTRRTWHLAVACGPGTGPQARSAS